MRQDLSKLSGKELNIVNLPLYFQEQGGKCQFLPEPIQFTIPNEQSDNTIEHFNYSLRAYILIAETSGGAAIITDDRKAVYLYVNVDEECEYDDELYELDVIFTGWHDNRKYQVVQIADSLEEFAKMLYCNGCC